LLKKHIITNKDWYLLFAKVHPANVHDTKSGLKVLDEFCDLRDVKTIIGDNGYRGTFYDFVTKVLNKTMIISKKIKDSFVIQPKRWVVERTFSWLNSYRRLSKDFEYTVESAESFVMIVFIMIGLKRLKT